MTENEFLSLLGQITIEHTKLEEIIDSLLFWLIDPSDSNIGGAILLDYSFIGRKLDLLSRLYRYIHSNHGESIVKNIIEYTSTFPLLSPFLVMKLGSGENFNESVRGTLSLENFSESISKTKDIIKRRNNLIHSEWNPDGEGNYILTKAKLSMDGLGSQKVQDIDITEIINLLDDYKKAQEELTTMHNLLLFWIKLLSSEGKLTQRDFYKNNTND